MNSTSERLIFLLKGIVILFILRGAMIVFGIGPTWIPYVDNFLRFVMSTINEVARTLANLVGIGNL